MKSEKNMKKKSRTVNKLLRDKRRKKEKKLESYASVNLANIDDVLKKYRPDDEEDLRKTVIEFMDSIIQGEACSLHIPDNFGPGVASLLLNNMAYWLGNTHEALRTKQSIEKLTY